MAEVIELAVTTKLDLPVERVIKRAAEASLTEIVVVGFDEDGELFFAATKADAGAVIWQLEMAKYRLLKLCDVNEPMEGA